MTRDQLRHAVQKMGKGSLAELDTNQLADIISKFKSEQQHEYDPLEDLKNGLALVGIKVGAAVRGGGHKFTFEGTEKQFKAALRKFMKINKWEKQDADWFPGDPGDTDEPAYFIEKDHEGEHYETALDFNNKVLENII